MRKLNPYKSTIVGLFLTGFISVFVCDSLCSTGLIFSEEHVLSQVALSDHHANNESHHEEPGHDHHHSDEHDHQQAPSEDDCCDDRVSSIYASLIKQGSENLYKVFASPLIYKVQDSDNTAAVFHQKSLSLLHTNLPPPSSGFEIRLLIQSFLN